MLRTRVCRLHAAHDLRVETDTVHAPGPGEVLVTIAAGGICGSDLHYFHHGGFGPVRVKEPIILGHEIAGTVVAVGKDVSVAEGTRVALNPSLPCHQCGYCREGLEQHCLNMRFLGSARTMPHVQGGFREHMVVDAERCVPVGDTDLSAAAFAEPLAVCLHAVNRAGPVAGKRVLVTGAGPIGSLTVAAARLSGADEIIVTDLHDAPLAVAKAMGATVTHNVTDEPDALRAESAGKGTVDVAFECSGAAPALAVALDTVRPQGTIVQVGIAGDLPVPIDRLVGKEIALVGTHRFHTEFATAARLIADRAIDVTPGLTARYKLDQAAQAFAHAGDRRRAVKVQFEFINPNGL